LVRAAFIKGKESEYAPLKDSILSATAVQHGASLRIAAHVAHCQMSRGDDDADEVAV
jgi:hypothetical protein